MGSARRILVCVATCTAFLVPAAPRIRAAARRAASEVEYYEYDGWKCAYRHKPGIAPPIILLHPIGLGLSSWFWARVAALLPNEVYAPDFIGCGESEAWVPDERGLSLPSEYAKQVEALWRAEIGEPCVVATQGGLAPVGALLASRASDDWNGSKAVAALALLSPPGWAAMAGGLRRADVSRNYDRLTSRLGLFGFEVIRGEAFVRFFSDLFLFCDRCDDAWVENCVRDDARPSSREPVLSFNAGVVNARPLGNELADLEMPVLILEGASDRRRAARDGYVAGLRDCERREIPGGLNVLPWEAPAAVAAQLSDLALRASPLPGLERLAGLPP